MLSTTPRSTSTAFVSSFIAPCVISPLAAVSSLRPTTQGAFVSLRSNASFPAIVAPQGTSVAPEKSVLRMAVINQTQVAIVTGASSSIGLYAAKTLAERGYHVVMAVRNPEKARSNAASVGLKSENYTVLPLDLSNLDSVRSFVKNFQTEFRKLNVLVCNAATWHPRDKEPRFTVDGFDETVQVNHLAHFLLANLLIPKLQMSSGRIVFLGTQTHNPDTLPGKIPPQANLGDLNGMADGFTSLPGTIDGKDFEPTKAYKDSKVCNILTMREMARRYPGVTVNAIFPGCIAESDLFREKRGWFRFLFPLFQKYVTKQYVSVEEAGRRVALVASDGMFGDSGTYWQWRGAYLEGTDKTKPVPIETNMREEDKAGLLWDLSAKLVNVNA